MKPLYINCLILSCVLVLWVAEGQEKTRAGTRSARQQGEISGLVRDQATHRLLLGANVLVVGTELGAASDDAGRFLIKNVSPGTYSLRASLVGHTTLVKTDVVVTSGRRTEILLEMAETVLRLDEVTVRADYFAKPREMATSVHALSYEEVRRSPGAAADVSRVALSLPGVVSSADLRNDLIVRGGSPAENLTLIDNIEMPNINHFATQGASGGPIGMVVTEIIRDVTFVTGGFPAKHGDKLSSVMEIELREGNRERTELSLNVNAALMGFIGEGPLLEKGSWLVSARRSYLEFLLRTFHFSGITVIPNFYDLQSKFVYDVDERNKFSLIAVGGIDDVSFAGAEKENYGSNPDLSGIHSVKNNQYQYVLGGTWKHLWKNAGYSFLALSNSRNHYFTDIDDSLGNKTYKNTSTESEYSLKVDATFQAARTGQFSFGGGGKLVDIRHALFLKADTSRWADRIKGTGIFPRLDYDKTFASYKLWAYAQYTQWLFSRITVTPGIRADYFDYVDQGFTLSPRLAVRYYLTDRTSANASYGIYFQTPAYIWLTTDERNRSLKPLRADHYTVGVEHLIQDDFRFTLDAYRKEYKHYPVSGYIPSYILVNGGASAGAFIAGDLRSVGTGYATGVEVFLQKKLTQDYYGTLSYAYSRTRFTALDGIERPGVFDYRHVLTLIAGYKVSENLEFSLKWRITGGNPYTPIDENLSKLFGRETMDLTRINGARYPTYHRIDIRTDYRFNVAGWEAVAYLDLQNAYNRKNIFYYVWDNESQTQSVVYQWSILPIFGLTLTF
ncbi:MAG: TonB-dependent receptor [Ignavibacteria bacterium]|nr:TonB-dependent receptor [Ignavibacteria bacterium]